MKGTIPSCSTWPGFVLIGRRYAEGRKYWALLLQYSRILARIIWIHNEEREGDEGKEDLLAKLFVTSLESS